MIMCLYLTLRKRQETQLGMPKKSAIHNYLACGGHKHRENTLMMNLIEIKVADTCVATISRQNP